MSYGLRRFGLSTKASLIDLKSAYLREVKLVHPDTSVSGNHDAFIKLKKDYEHARLELDGVQISPDSTTDGFSATNANYINLRRHRQAVNQTSKTRFHTFREKFWISPKDTKQDRWCMFLGYAGAIISCTLCGIWLETHRLHVDNPINQIFHSNE